MPSFAAVRVSISFMSSIAHSDYRMPASHEVQRRHRTYLPPPPSRGVIASCWLKPDAISRHAQVFHQMPTSPRAPRSLPARSAATPTRRLETEGASLKRHASTTIWSAHHNAASAPRTPRRRSRRAAAAQALDDADDDGRDGRHFCHGSSRY